MIIKLKKNQNIYNESIGKLRSINSSIEKINKIEYEDLFNNNMNDEINQIINNNNAKCPLFIKKKSIKLIKRNVKVFKKYIENIKFSLIRSVIYQKIIYIYFMEL